MPQDNFDGYRLLTSMNKAGIPAIVVSGYVDSQRIERAYADGLIIACLEKQSFEKKSFEQAILAAQSFDPVDPIIKTLTDREREVLALLAQGMTNKEIASRLTITSNTVKRHLKSLFTKLNVNTRSAASARAITLRINRS
jgi:RNA polymerase sigma factor (sigma-70 family)